MNENASIAMNKLGKAEKFLAALDEDWSELVTNIGAFSLEPKPQRKPYEALIRAVAHQQLHSKAADAILKRFTNLYPKCAFPSPKKLLNTNEIALRECGFSQTKVASILDIADKTLEGIVPTIHKALLLSDEDLIARLITIRGVGQWTVEMFLIYTLERPDILPVNDFGVREGYKVLKSLEKQPTPKALFTAGLKWQPYRTAAAWYLWRAADRAKENKKELK